MKEKASRLFKQIITYLPLAGIISAAAMNTSSFQRQLLMALLLVWMNAFFLYKSWGSQ
jgi:hypothetical protein